MSTKHWYHNKELNKQGLFESDNVPIGWEPGRLPFTRPSSVGKEFYIR